MVFRSRKDHDRCFFYWGTRVHLEIKREGFLALQLRFCFKA